MSTPQKFVQILQFETDRIDEMRALAADADQRLAGRPDGPVRRLLLKDRSRPGRYLVVVEFDSYEAAMRNSDDPDTGKFAQAMAALCTTPPSFTDCDVVEAAELR
jgi:hypothetical protein